MESESNNLADLARQVLSAWETVHDNGDDLADIVDKETFLGVQYAQLHVDGIAQLTLGGQAVLEHAYETLTENQEES